MYFSESNESDAICFFYKCTYYFISITKVLENKNETENLVRKCEEAYRITTSISLAGSFQKRADNLSNSMWGWVLLLIFSLIAGAFSVSYNIGKLSEIYSKENINVNLLVFQNIVSILSVGAPIWFSWVATKQITQRFRLSEDYAFKSAVAKAYEGYRKEATRIDPALEDRLFSSALTRLEEAPLRLVDKDNYGSPWHEFFGSNPFKEALDKIPDFKEFFIEMIKTNKNNQQITEERKIEIKTNA